MPDQGPVVAVISAVPAAIPPTVPAFEEFFPAATVWNILDDRLLADAARHGGLTEALSARMRRLIDHAVLGGADAILLTCSMYAPVAHQARAAASIPVLGPDDALFEAAAHGGHRRLTVVSSAADPLADSVARLRHVLDPQVAVHGVIAHGAAEAACAGDVTALAGLVAAAVTGAPQRADAIVLGQYSLTPSAPAVQEMTGVPTLSGPAFAVQKLRAMVSGALA